MICGHIILYRLAAAVLPDLFVYITSRQRPLSCRLIFFYPGYSVLFQPLEILFPRWIIFWYGQKMA